MDVEVGTMSAAGEQGLPGEGHGAGLAGLGAVEHGELDHRLVGELLTIAGEEQVDREAGCHRWKTRRRRPLRRRKRVRTRTRIFNESGNLGEGGSRL